MQKTNSDDIDLLDLAGLASPSCRAASALDLVDVAGEVADVAREDMRDAIVLLQALELRLRSIGRH
jgi:hypothetical protein